LHVGLHVSDTQEPVRRIAPKGYGNSAHPGPLSYQRKQAAGKVTGDAKLQAEGSADKAAGKVQNAVGGAKDAVRDALKH
jgi:hypothetical protein